MFKKLLVVLALAITTLTLTWALKRDPSPTELAAGAGQGDAASDSGIRADFEGLDGGEPVTGTPPAGSEPSRPISENGNLDSASLKSLMDFADQLAPQVEAAEKDPEKARALMSDLENCLQPSDSRSIGMKALCFSTAEELALNHSELKPRFEALKQTTDPAVISFLEDGGEGTLPAGTETDAE